MYRQQKSPASNAELDLKTRDTEPLSARRQRLNVKRGAATAGALHVRVLELEPGAFQGLDVIDMRSAQIHQGSGIHVNLQTVKIENLVHHAGAVLEGHGILKSRATAADYGQPQSRRDRRLRGHNLF